MPQLAGIYTTELTREMGSGITRQGTVQKLDWFAIYLDDERVVVRALGGDGLPTMVSKVLSAREFFSDYTPSRELYIEKVMPLLESVQGKLAESSGDESVLDRAEKTIFHALVLDAEHLPGVPKDERREVALKLLKDLPSFENIFAEHKKKINIESISSRKDGNFDEAIDLYGAMLRVTPDDDHIFFNVARVYFEKKNFVACRNYLRLALEHDASFDEASKFLKYLDERVIPDQPEGRVYLRYRFFQNQPCTLTLKGQEFEAYVVDLSEAGVQIRMAPGSKARLAADMTIHVRGESEILQPLLPGNEGRIVWATKTTCGVALVSKLESSTEAFRKIIACAHLA